jgi:hypothetical protein
MRRYRFAEIIASTEAALEAELEAWPIVGRFFNITTSSYW